MPDIKVELIDGAVLNLREIGEKAVIYFFPKAFSPVCTKEACSFRDAAPRFEGVRVIGVSRDSASELVRFSDQYHLNHAFVSDADGELHREFGALLFGKLPRRATFTIDATGVIEKVYANDLSATGHAEQAL